MVKNMIIIKKIIKKVIPARPAKEVDIDSQINVRIKQFISAHKNFNLSSISRRSSYAGRVEVLIPCYNHADFLEEALLSVVNQTYRGKIAVTFINDASTDRSLAVMKQLKRKYSSKKIFIKAISNKKNLLQAGSLNKAIINSSNELFIVLNADDILTPDCIALTLDTFKSNKNIFLLGGGSLWFETSDELPNYKTKMVNQLKLSVYGPADAIKFKHPNDINISHSSMSFVKSAWMSVGGYYLDRTKRVCSHDDRDFEMRICSLMPIGIYQDYPMEFYRTDSSKGRGTI